MEDRTDHLLFLTATPHKGDPDNFALLLQLLDKDLYAIGDILAEASAHGENRIIIRRLKEDMKKFDGSACFSPRANASNYPGIPAKSVGSSCHSTLHAVAWS